MPSDNEAQVSHEPQKSNHHRKLAPENSPAHQERTSASAEYFALVAQATNDAVRDWNVKTGRLDWPQGLENLLGHLPSTASAEIGFWQRHIHPEDRPQIAAGIRDALAKDEHWSGEYRFRRADGSYVAVLERAIILRNDAGDPVRFVSSIKNITIRKELQEQFCRSQRMEAFGQLASGVAHDFNNFLTAILGYSDLILGSASAKTTLGKHVLEIRKAARRASGLTGQLLAFSRKHPLDARVLEVNTFICNLERSILPLLGEYVSVECDLYDFPDGSHIKVDPEQMKQVILNLAVNARDAMPTGGLLKIATGSLRIHDAIGATNSDELPPGEYVTISLSDDGIGMTDEVKSHLFEPFFTTKQDARRSGLGLATSYGIVRQSGGRITAKSELGGGTIVTISLPKVDAPPPPTYKSPSSNETPRGTETILVLEDDIGVRHLSVRLLRSLGYHVIEAANGDDAQRRMREDNGRKIHLVLTDVVMPQMSGHHFADWLCQESPQTKVIFISGYLDESTQLATSRDKAAFFLPKPFDVTQLALKVREALDAK